MDLITYAALKKKIGAIDEKNDNFLNRKLVSSLPTVSKTYDFQDGIPQFTAANRSYALMGTEGDNKYQQIKTNVNAANEYAFAFLDLSDLTNGAKRIIIDFKARMHDGARWYISLSDLGKRPGNSNRTNYDKTGVVFTHGTTDGKYLYINSNNTWKSSYINVWFNSHIDIDVESRTVSYTISNGNPSDTLSGTVSFLNDDISQITALEIYSYVNSIVLDIDDISINCIFADEPSEKTVYILQDGDVFTECIYIDGRPFVMGRSDIVSVVNDLAKRVIKLESEGTA